MRSRPASILHAQVPTVSGLTAFAHYSRFASLVGLGLLRSSLVSRHTRLKGRVVESAGIRSYRERSGPDRWHNRPGVDGVVADKAQTHCPRLERLVPKVLKNRKCLDTYELFNMSWLTHTTHGDRNTGSSDPDGHSCIFVARADRPRWFSLPRLLRPPLRPLLFVRHARERAQALAV